MKVKIWLDDVRSKPFGYIHCHSVNETIDTIEILEEQNVEITELNLDHDLGDYATDGGDGIKLVLWLTETERYYPIVIHSMNPVGRMNMEAIIKRYWK